MIMLRVDITKTSFNRWQVWANCMVLGGASNYFLVVKVIKKLITIKPMSFLISFLLVFRKPLGI